MLEMVIKEIDEQRRIVIPKEWCDEMKIKDHAKMEMIKKSASEELLHKLIVIINVLILHAKNLMGKIFYNIYK